MTKRSVLGVLATAVIATVVAIVTFTPAESRADRSSCFKDCKSAFNECENNAKDKTDREICGNNYEVCKANCPSD